MADGEAMSFDAVKANQKLIEENMQPSTPALDGPQEGDTDWQVVGYCVNWEDEDLYCAHTNERIQSAYGEGDTE